jgi:hypothetical protein
VTFPTNYVARWRLSRDGASDTRDLELVLPIRTESETNQREHWARRHRRRKAQRTTAGLVVRSLLLAEGLGVPCRVTLTRIAPRRLDSDNLVSSLKGPRDGVADALGVDDADERVEWAYGQRRGKPREYGVQITIEQRRERGVA